MALVLADRVNETTTTTGTGTVTLAGAVDGYQSFTVIGNGNTTYYTIVHQTLNEWEVGIGTYTASGTTLSRDTILASSNGGSAVNFSAGTKFVFCDYPAGRAVYLDSSTNVTVPQITLSSGTANGVLYLNGSKVATSGGNLTFDGTTLFAQYLNLNQWYSYNDNDRDANSSTYLPTASARSFRYAFVNASSAGTGGNYAGLLQFNPWTGTTGSTGDASYQLFFGSTATNGSGFPWLRIRKGIDSTWNTGYNIPLYDANTSYASALYSTIVYDANNTAYYVDPSGSASFVGAGYISGTNGRLVLRDNSIENWATASDSAGIAVNYYGYNLGTAYFRDFDVYDGKNNARLNVYGSANYTQATGSLRAPIFYDSNDTGYYVDPASTSRLYVTLTNVPYFGVDTNKGYAQGYGTYSSSLHKIAYMSLDWDSQYNSYANHGIASTDSNGSFSDSVSINSFNDINLRIDSNNNNADSYVRFHNNTTGSNQFAYIGYNGANYLAYFTGILYGDASTRSPIFYDLDNTGYYVDPNSSTSANFYGSVNAATYNLAGLLVNASGTSSSGGAIAIQQATAEGWTGIFCDYEPYTGWGLWHDNPNNYFSFTSESSTGSIRSFSVPSRVSGLRTAYEKFRVDQGSGDTITGAIGYANASFRAPIFYDSNDTNYYVDPASFTNLNAVNATRIGVNPSGSSSNGYGISLYGGYNAAEPTYGLMFQGTSTFGTYGSVSGDWATYFTMNNDPARGWIFRNVGTGNVAGINSAGQMTLASHFEQGNNLGRPNVNWSASGTSTGMVIFYLPGTTSNYGMVHMVFDIYEYSSNSVSTVIVGGHNWSTSWYNYGANVIGSCAKEVRLGVKDGRFCVVFGVSGSSWSYGTIVLRKIHNAGFYDNVMNMTGDWSSTQTTTESFTNITGDLRNLITPTNIDVRGIGYAVDSFRAPIFYDRDNTGYYGDFASTSNLNVLGVQRAYAGYDAGVTNSFSCSDWFRSSGTSGWYNASYAGGIYMTDSTWVRVYNNKAFLAEDTIQSNASVRGPIFYDSNNTGYYVDPASTSNLNSVAWSTTGAGGITIGNGTATEVDVAYSSSGGTWEVGFNNNYGTNSWFWYRGGTGYLGGLDQSANMFIEGSSRAPIFYDSNNTGYYTDPASTSSLSGVVLNGGLGAYADGVGNDPYGFVSVTRNSGANYSYFGMTRAGQIGTGFGIDTSNQIWFGSTTPGYNGTRNSTWFYFNSSGDVYAPGSFRAPIFYDSNDTGYYLDPNSESKVRKIWINNGGAGGVGWATGLNMGDGSNYWNMIQDAGVARQRNFGTGGYDWFNSGASQVMTLSNGGTLSVSSDMRAPIFYDSNDTTYYCNPNDWSLLWGLKTYYIQNNYSVSTDHPFGVYFDSGLSTAYAIYREPGAWTNPYPDLRIAFHTGIKLGANASYQGVRFYDDYGMGTQVMSVNNGSDPLGANNVYVNYNLQAGDSLRAPIFYDSNNTGYYFDGNGTSRWTTSNQDGFHTFNNYGLGVVGLYASTRYQCVFAMGDAYKGNADGTSLSGAYGLWWSYPSAGGPASNLTSHGLMCIVNGTFYASLDASMRAISDMRAPIFYDYNNTGYYVDPANSGSSGAASFNGGITFGIANPYLQSSSYFVIPGGAYFNSGTVYCSAAIQARGGVQNDSGVALTLLGGTGGYTNINGSARSPIFYDSDNTAYYADLSSTGDSIRAAGNIVAYYSDERLKTHLGKIENALEKVDQLEGFYYEANEVAQKLGYKAKREVGVSAQAVQRVLPEIVTNAPISANYLTIDYERLVPLLIEAIKELKGEVETLKSRLH